MVFCVGVEYGMYCLGTLQTLFCEAPACAQHLTCLGLQTHRTGVLVLHEKFIFGASATKKRRVPDKKRNSARRRCFSAPK